MRARNRPQFYALCGGGGSKDCALSSEIPEILARWDLAERVAREPGDAQWRARDLRARGQFLVYRGAFDRAAEAYRQAAGTEPLQEDPRWTGDVRASVFRTLAQLDALGGDLAAARDDMASALAIQPECPRGLFFAGRFAAGAGDVAAARAYLAAGAQLPGEGPRGAVAECGGRARRAAVGDGAAGR